MSRCEGLAGQVSYPVTELIVTRRDKAALLTVKGVTDCEPRLTSIAMRWEVWGDPDHTSVRGRHATPGPLALSH